jgi:hypothetical protein
MSNPVRRRSAPRFDEHMRISTVNLEKQYKEVRSAPLSAQTNLSCSVLLEILWLIMLAFPFSSCDCFNAVTPINFYNVPLNCSNPAFDRFCPLGPNAFPPGFVIFRPQLE